MIFKMEEKTRIFVRLKEQYDYIYKQMEKEKRVENKKFLMRRLDLLNKRLDYLKKEGL